MNSEKKLTGFAKMKADNLALREENAILEAQLREKPEGETFSAPVIVETPSIVMMDVWPDHDQKSGHQFIGKTSDAEKAIFVEVLDFHNDSGWESLPERMKAFAKHACDWVTDQPQVLPKFDKSNRLRATFEILK